MNISTRNQDGIIHIHHNPRNTSAPPCMFKQYTYGAIFKNNEDHLMHPHHLLRASCLHYVISSVQSNESLLLFLKSIRESIGFETISIYYRIMKECFVLKILKLEIIPNNQHTQSKIVITP